MKVSSDRMINPVNLSTALLMVATLAQMHELCDAKSKPRCGGQRCTCAGSLGGNHLLQHGVLGKQQALWAVGWCGAGSHRISIFCLNFVVLP